MTDTFFELTKQFNKIKDMVESNANDVEIELELIELESVASNMVAYLSRKRADRMCEMAKGIN